MVFVLVVVIVFLAFMWKANTSSEIALSHAPDVAAPTDMTEGLQIVGVGIGYVVCLGLLVAALLSAVISLMPLAINRTIEHAVDNTLEEGRRHIHDLEHNVKDEFERLGKKQETKDDNEDPSRFMPRQ